MRSGEKGRFYQVGLLLQVKVLGADRMFPEGGPQCAAAYEATRAHVMTLTERDWRMKVDATRNEDELLGIVRAYIATIAPEDFEKLPAEAQPGYIVDAQELAMTAYKLVAAHCASVHQPDDGGVLFRVATFFAYAQARVAFLASPAARQRAYISKLDLLR